MTKVVIIAYNDYKQHTAKKRRKLAYIYTLIYKVRIQAYINSVIITP